MTWNKSTGGNEVSSGGRGRVALLGTVMKTLMRLWLLAGLLAGVCGAQDSPVAGPPACRFLFYVDSSRGMSRWSSAAATTVSHLVATGVSGRMQAGDAFAVWHYNEEPFQFEFPIRTWTPGTSEALAREAGNFLRKLRFDRREQSGMALREMYLAMAAVDALTVVVVSNGETPMVGTPFDVAINKAYLERGEDVRQKRLPLVTTLHCANKKVVTWAVTVGKEEIVLSELAGTASPGRTFESPVAGGVVPASPVRVPEPAAGGGRVTEPAAIPARSAVVPPVAFAPTVPVPVATPAVAVGMVQTVAVPAPAAVVSPTAPKVNPGARILDIFAIPFTQPAGTAASTAAASTGGAGGAASNVVAAAGLPVVAAPEVGTPAVGMQTAGGGLTGVGTGGLVSGPTNVLKIVAAAPGFARLPGAEAGTNAGLAVALVPLPGVATTNAGAAASPLSVLRINPPRTNALVVAGAGTNAVAFKPGVEFARKSAPTFAGEAGRVNPTGDGAGTTAVPGGRAEKLPAAGAATVASNLVAKPLATVPVLVDENPKTRPVQFLVAGVITLVVAAWFVVLLWRGSRPRSRTSISRAMDE